MKTTMMCYERDVAPMCKAHERKILFGKLCERKYEKAEENALLIVNAVMWVCVT